MRGDEDIYSREVGGMVDGNWTIIYEDRTTGKLCVAEHVGSNAENTLWSFYELMLSKHKNVEILSIERWKETEAIR